MKIAISIIGISLLCQPIFAQRDPLHELDKWSRKEAQNRSYQPGEEVWALLTNKARAESRAAAPPLRSREVVLDNAGVLKMKAAGFSDDTIINAINTRQSLFDTTPDAIIAMKHTGISEAVINAMMGADSGNRGNLIALDKNGLPAEVGIYIQQSNKLIEMEAEPISWQTGGIWKAFFTRLATLGVAGTKGHVNAKVMDARSRFQVDNNAEFIIRTPEGVTPSEYVLVELHEKENRREFRFLTGGWFHPSSGAERNTTPFTYRKLAPRTYYVMLNNLRRGEYGFLPTHLANSIQAAFIGKLYSFSVD